MNRESRNLIFWLLAIVFCFSLTRPSQAQYNASIQGVVQDPQGAVVPGATVTLVNLETNWTKTDKTNGHGIYTFNALPPSHFSVTVVAPGFKKQVLSDVQVMPEQANSVNIQLELGSASQSVTVSGAGTGMDTETAAISGTITSRQIATMPSFGRDITQLVQLAPGIFGDGAQASGGGPSTLIDVASGASGIAIGNASGPFATQAGINIVSSGSQSEENNMLIDGVSVTDSWYGGATVIIPTEDSVKSMTVVSNNYDADNGGYLGGEIKIITKNGTNTLHGSLFIKGDRPGLNAFQRYSGPQSLVSGTAAQKGVNRDDGRFNQYGGSLGGPILKNKIFAFFAYEGLGNNALATSDAWFETPQYRAMAPGNSLAATLLSYPGEGVASSATLLSTTCATIGLSQGTNCAAVNGGLNLGSPLTTPLGYQDPRWTGSGNPGIGSGLTTTPTIAEYQTVNPTSNAYSQYNGRVDVNLTKKDLLIGTLYWEPTHETEYLGSARAANLGHIAPINNAFTLVWDHTFSPNLLNEARANASGFRLNEIKSNPTYPFGIPRLPMDNFGTIDLAEFGVSFTPQWRDDWTYSYGDTFTMVKGNHQLKYGGVFTLLQYLQTDPNTAIPQFNFHNMWDLLNDAPYEESGGFALSTGKPFDLREDYREDDFNFFVQDDYRVTPTLTLNLGLLWDYFGSVYTKGNNLPVVEYGTGQNYLLDEHVRLGGHLYTPTKNNWGPQVGFAWSPSRDKERLVIRGGFGISYNRINTNAQAYGYVNFPELADVTIGPYTTNVPVSQTNMLYAFSTSTTNINGFPANPHAETPSNPATNLPVAGSLPVSEGGFPSSMPDPVSYHQSLDLQYNIGDNWVADLGYSGQSTRHLTRRVDNNVIALAAGIPWNPLIEPNYYFDQSISQEFSSMIAALNHQFAHSFQARAQFVWSKGMDDNSSNYYINPYEYDHRLMWGRSDYNVTDAFKLFGVWSPTLFHGSHDWVEKVADGWSLSGILNLHTGFPWTPEYTNLGNGLYYAGAPYANVLFPGKYLGGAGHSMSNSTFRSGPNPHASSTYNENYSNGALAYYTVPAYTLGPAFPQETATLPQPPGVERNSLNGPNYRDVDMSLLKNFGLPNKKVLGEAALIQIRADAYNLFNFENLTNINDIISTDGVHSNPSFGQAQGGLGSRTIELQARFQF